MTSQIKIGHVINPLATYIPSYWRLTERPMMHDFEMLGIISALFKR